MTYSLIRHSGCCCKESFHSMSQVKRNGRCASLLIMIRSDYLLYLGGKCLLVRNVMVRESCAPGNWKAGVHLPPEMRGSSNPREPTVGIDTTYKCYG